MLTATQALQLTQDCLEKTKEQRLDSIFTSIANEASLGGVSTTVITTITPIRDLEPILRSLGYSINEIDRTAVRVSWAFTPENTVIKEVYL